MSSRTAIIDERVRQLQRAIAEAKQETVSAQSSATHAGAVAAAWEKRARAAEEWIRQLERDIAVGLIRSVDEVEDLAHSYQPPAAAAVSAAFLRSLSR